MSTTALTFDIHSIPGVHGLTAEVLGGITLQATYVEGRFLSDGRPSWGMTASLHCDDAPSLRALATRLIESAELVEAADARAALRAEAA